MAHKSDTHDKPKPAQPFMQENVEKSMAIGNSEGVRSTLVEEARGFRRTKLSRKHSHLEARWGEVNTRPYRALLESNQEHSGLGNCNTELRLSTSNDLDVAWVSRMSDDVQSSEYAPAEPCQHTAHSAATPCTDLLNARLTCQKHQEQPCSSESKPSPLHLIQNARVLGSGYARKHSRRSPSIRFERIDLQGDPASRLRKLKPIVISNAVPGVRERFRPVTFLVISRRKSRNKKPASGLRDTGADANAISMRLAKKLKANFNKSKRRLPLLKPFGAYHRRVRPKSCCWLKIEFPGIEGLFWVEFYVFDNSIMYGNDCIFSVKTCIKASLILDGLAD